MYLPGSKVIPVTNANLFLELQSQVGQGLLDNPWVSPRDLKLSISEMKSIVLQNSVILSSPCPHPMSQ